INALSEKQGLSEDLVEKGLLGSSLLSRENLLGGSSAIGNGFAKKITKSKTVQSIDVDFSIPENLTPKGAKRAGAFNEAKRRSGIPVSQSPTNVYQNVDKRGNKQPGVIYEFEIPATGGSVKKVYIRDDAKGHFYGENNPQNRGPHFNDQKGNHYDY
ncbi:HNH/endonuclease VII fold putative polymorphic toxin, partial [Pasteurellaceae bacterium LIM206]|nr:HNH/endonuclease VII fold putative polymorphic toxin [Pasteurellaceae bacterium LIM206]